MNNLLTAGKIPLRKIVFIVRDRRREAGGNSEFSAPDEILRAVDYLRDNGIESEALEAGSGILETASPRNAEGCAKPECAGTLYVTDDPGTLGLFLEAHLPVCAYERGEYGGEPDRAALGKASYIISGPDEIATDDYCKIYERLTGQPWTILETDRILVRETVEEDMDGLYGCYDEEALRYVEGLPSREIQQESMRSYREKVYGFYGFGHWSLIDRESGRFAGLMGYEPYQRGEEAVSFGYILHPDFRGKGYASEAGRAILDYGRDVLGFTSVQAAVSRENEASVRLLEKLGFRHLQTQKKGDKIEEIFFVSC